VAAAAAADGHLERRELALEVFAADVADAAVIARVEA
jgi:hypothetical protein